MSQHLTNNTQESIAGLSLVM